MALPPNFPESPHKIIDPSVRWLPDNQTLKDTDYGKLLPPLVHKIREDVKAWRDEGYRDATETSKALLNWWFNTPHPIEGADGTMSEFQYYFAQREALETVIYLYDAFKVRDKYDLMRFDSSGAISTGMFDEDWRRFVLKMATGTGKTKVMSLAIAWSFFHKLYEPDSELSRNFLVIAPNIIVLDRIYHDFQGLRVFFADPVLPDNGFAGRNWRDDFQLTLHLQDEVRVTRPTGNIFLTNIHRVYSTDQSPPSPDDENSMDYFLGRRPTGATTDSKVDLGIIVRDILERRPMGEGANPKTPLVIEVDKENRSTDIDTLDIEIPILTRRVYREYNNLGALDLAQLDFTPVRYQNFSEEEQREIVFRDLTTGLEAHRTVMDSAGVADYRNALGYFAHTLMKELKLVSGYDVLYGKVKGFYPKSTVRRIGKLGFTQYLTELGGTRRHKNRDRNLQASGQRSHNTG